MVPISKFLPYTIQKSPPPRGIEPIPHPKVRIQKEVCLIPRNHTKCMYVCMYVCKYIYTYSLYIQYVTILFVQSGFLNLNAN